MADIQALIDSGLSPEDAALLAADLQRYETAGAPNLNLGVAPQTTMRNGVQYQNLYGGMDIIPGMTSSILDRIGIENPQVPVYSILEAQAQKNPNDARRMSFMPTPGSAYRLVDNATGDVIMSAATPEEYAALAQRANELAASEGKRANFEIQRQDPQSLGGGFTPIYSDTPDVAFDTTAQLMLAAMLAMTGAGALQPGGFGGVGAGATGAGAGIGTGTSLAGQGLASLPANLASIQAGANTALAGAGLGGGAFAPAAAASTLIPVATEAGTILVTAPAAAGIGIETIAPLAIGTGTAGGLLASAGGSGAGSSASSATGSGTGPNASTFPDEIVVTAKNTAPFTIPTTVPVAAGTGLTASLLAGAQPTALPEVGPIDKAGTPLKAADYLRIANLASGIASGIAGGGGGGGALGPDNSAISYTPLNRQQMTRKPSGAGLGAYGFDPFTYGQASGNQPGEYLFFQPAATTPVAVVPSGAVGLAEGGDVDDDMVKHLIEYRKGGGHNGPGHVRGIGSGQEDKIPAWLSDGEYVWSAQDVADLGDGSTDEGVRRLDKMRQMVRHRAGRKDVKKIAKPQKGIESLLAAVGGK